MQLPTDKCLCLGDATLLQEKKKKKKTERRMYFLEMVNMEFSNTHGLKI